MTSDLRLGPERLRRQCDPDHLTFATTAELPPLDATIGQPRAIDAIAFGLDIQDSGYNLFALGPTGTGKRTTLRAYLDRIARDRATPGDWVYLNDFAHERHPIAVELPPGIAAGLARDMERFVSEARREITRAFESDDWQRRTRQLASDLDGRREQAIAAFRDYARQHGLALEFTSSGVMTLPLIDGNPASGEEFERLSEADKEAYRTHSREVEERVPEVISEMRGLERQAREGMSMLEREVALFAVGHLVDDLKGRYSQVERLQGWLEEVREDVLDHVAQFRGPAETPSPESPAEPLAVERRRALDEAFGRYEVNVLVSRTDGEGAPVVSETSPTYANLFGRVEYGTVFGAFITDHRRIRAGAIHRANGGYLMLQAADVLGEGFAWERLKETLREGRARIENAGAAFTLFPTSTLDPEPIPVRLKVILVGPAPLYQALYLLDPEFRKLFKVRAEFAYEMPWGDDETMLYACFVASRVRTDGLRDFDRGAVARVVEHGSRIAEHQGKLTTRFAEIVDLVTEASYWAGEAGRSVVTGADVEEAIDRRRQRADLPEQRLRELVLEGTLRIDTTGTVAGQVNGLAVLNAGDRAFGQPIRITATTAVGRGEVVHVDRETALSGPIHSKGFLILSAFLREHYGHERPLALRASLVVEQSYEEIEGDSASLAELCALLSSLGELPVRQGVAVTGAVDQHGAVEPIGGVNEKIEGFFRLCQARGLTGDQGVIMPAANVRHLMLDHEVVEAVRDGRFSIWAVDVVDQATELLTGLPGGERGPDGSYPEGTLHRHVDDRLTQLAELARRLWPEPEPLL
jgi:lon-related putative ATP-dependent protease